MPGEDVKARITELTKELVELYEDEATLEVELAKPGTDRTLDEKSRELYAEEIEDALGKTFRSVTRLEAESD